VADIKIMSRHSPSGTEENHEESEDNRQKVRHLNHIHTSYIYGVLQQYLPVWFPLFRWPLASESSTRRGDRREDYGVRA
jgi:hypothetical protein